MDQIKDLSAFQGVILSADNCHSFRKITSKGGNEEKIKYIVNRLSNFLQEKNYIRDEGVVEENVENYRKLALYLILNADFPALEDMTETEGVGSVIWTLPTVPPFLLAELLAALRMDRFAAEAAARARPALALQLLAALAAHLRHLRPARRLPRAAALAAAAHRLLARLPLHRPDAHAPRAALRAFRACLRCFVEPPEDERHRHLARALALLFGLVDECVRRYTAREPLRSGGPEDLYLATLAPNDLLTDALDFDVCDGPDEAIRRCFTECHEALFDTCAALVMNVSVDVFCAWSEDEEGGVSVQRAVGELCHRARAGLLRAAPCLPPHVLPELLRHLARAPPEPEPEVAALLARPDLCRHPSLLAELDTHLPDLDEDRSRTLFDKITEYLNEDRENGEYLKVLAAKAFQRCSARDKHAIVRRIFSEHLHDDLESVEFEKTANEILNRLTAAGSAPPAPPAAALTLFAQSPRRTLERVFRAAAAGAPQAALMLALMDELREYASASYAGAPEPCVVEVIDHALENFLDTDRERESFVEFVRGLRARGLVSADGLLRRVCMPRLQAALLRRDAAAADVALRLLARALGPARLRPRAPALAVLAQLLAALRWTPASFSPDVPRARDRALALIRDVLDSYGDERIPEKELSWLAARLRRLRPLERVHFGRVLPAPPPPLPELLRALPVLSAREWRYPLLPALGAGAGAGAGAGGDEAALVAAPAAALARRAARLPPACLLHALGNYVAHLQETYLAGAGAGAGAAGAPRVLAALRAAAGVVERAPAAARDELGAALAPLAGALPPAGSAPGARAAAARALRRAAPALAAALAADERSRRSPDLT